MADDPIDTPPTNAPPPAQGSGDPAPAEDPAPSPPNGSNGTPTAPGEKLYTKAEVESIVQRRLASSRRSVEPPPKPPDPAPPKQQPTQQPTTTVEELQAQFARFERNQRCQNLLAKYPHLTDFNRSIVSEKFLSENPEHAAEWVEEFLSQAGWAKPSPDAATPKPTNGAPPVPPKGNPNAIDNSAPQPGVGYRQIVDPGELTREHVQQILNEHKGNAGPKYLRTMAENFYKGVRVLPPTPKL